MDTHRIEIRASKKKSMKNIFYGFMLIGMGVFLLFIAESQEMMPPFTVKVIGYLSLAIFFTRIALYFLQAI